jgi:hypothetical protein
VLFLAVYFALLIITVFTAHLLQLYLIATAMIVVSQIVCNVQAITIVKYVLVGHYLTELNVYVLSITVLVIPYLNVFLVQILDAYSAIVLMFACKQILDL